MKKPTGAPPNVPTPLAGRRILLDGTAGSLAEGLRSAGAEVAQLPRQAPLAAQVAALEGADAAILALDAPAGAALALARAVRASGAPWAGIPLLGLAADPDPARAAAAAAGVDGLLARPVENTLLYETLARFISAGAARRAQPVAPAPATSVVPELLNLERLESYARLGMVDELVNDYLPEMKRLLRSLHEAAGRTDARASLAALHSLLGMSGEAGAQGLYQHVRKLYVPLLEHGEWPAAADWLPQLDQLAARTEEALKAYCTQQARSSAA